MNDAVETDAAQADAEWGDRLTLFLTYRGVEPDAARSCAREALAHCEESGERPEQAFGSAKEYAKSLAAAHLPASRRARADHPGELTPEDYREAPALVPGGFLIVCGAVLWFRDGLWTEVTTAGLAGCAMMVVTFVIAGWAQALRAEGRPRAAAGAIAVALVTAVLTAMALKLLPQTGFGRIPPSLLVPAGALLLWLGGRVRIPAAPTVTAMPARPRRGEADEPGEADEAGAPDAERWLRRLEGLLRGRHKVSRADARRLTAEAREHLSGSGTLPEEEFGDVEEYALRLVEEGAARRRTRESLSWDRTAMLFVLIVISLIDRDWDDFGWWQWCTVAAGAVTGGWLICNVRDKWPARKGNSPRSDRREDEA